MGITVYDQVINSSEMELDISNWYNGLYIIVVDNKTNRYLLNFLKK